ISDQLSAYLERNNLLCRQQFGFHKNKSTEHALLSAQETIIKSFEKNQLVLGLFVDIQKAFDSLKHNILIKKLRHYGLSGDIVDYMDNYLSNRWQFVSLESAQSDLRLIRFGVPQGSILGPLLFLVYINDIVQVSPYATCFLFADDTNLLITGRNSAE